MQIWDAISPADVTAFARSVPEDITNSLARVLPNRQLTGIKSRSAKRTRTNVAAMYRAYNAETPIGQRPQALTVTEVTLPPVGQKLPLTEAETLELEALRNGGGLDALVESVYDDTETNVRAIRNRIELARGQFLATGAFTLTAENGLTIEADYVLPGDHQVTPGVLWGAANPTPMTDERVWVQKVIDDSGEVPEFAVTSSRVRNAMLAAPDYRAAAYPGAGTSAPSLSIDGLNMVRAAYGLPPLFVYDGRVNVGGVNTRVIADDLFILATASVGETQFGITADAIRLAGSNAVDFTTTDAPGIFAAAYTSVDPVTYWSKATATAMPVAGDINGLLVADVF